MFLLSPFYIIYLLVFFITFFPFLFLSHLLSLQSLVTLFQPSFSLFYPFMNLLSKAIHISFLPIVQYPFPPLLSAYHPFLTSEHTIPFTKSLSPQNITFPFSQSLSITFSFLFLKHIIIHLYHSSFYSSKHIIHPLQSFFPSF